MRQFAFILLLQALFLIFSPVVLAQNIHQTEKAPVLFLADENAEYPLGYFLEILEDPSRKLTIEQVSSAEYAARFKASKSAIPNLGLTDSAYWVRFRVKSEVAHQTDWLLKYGFPNTHHISLYLPRINLNGYESINTGMLHPFNSRDIKHNDFVFRLPAINDTPMSIYLRIETETNLSLPFNILAAETFISTSLLTNLLHGLFFGILLVMTGYYGFLWLSLKDVNYFYLLLFSGCIWLFQFTWDGYSSFFLWPETPWLNDYVVRSFLALAIASMVLFTINFLKTKQYPILHRGLIMGLFAWCIVILMIPLVNYGMTIKQIFYLILFTLSTILITAVAALLQGNRSARLFLFGCTFLILVAIIVSLSRLGLVPSNMFTLQLGYQLGVIFLVLFLALSLMDNINRLKKEHDLAKNEALHASRAHEQLVMEKNTLLEKDVSKRTHELAHAHNIINESPAVAFLWKNSENWPVDYVSKNIIELTEYTSLDFTSGNISYKDIIHPDDYERVKQEVIDYSNATDFNHQSYRIITKSGIIKWLDDHTNILRDENDQIINYQGIVIDVTERELAKQELLKKQLSLNFLAHHDPLTNLPNRLLFMERMQQAIKKAHLSHTQFALLFIDLDGFKPINDTFGHDAGDAVLKIISEKLIKNVDKEDTVARLGGDEFVILMGDISGPQDAAVTAEKIINAQHQALQINHQELTITLSIGISLYPQDGDNIQTLIKRGDIAMYRSKKSAPNSYQFFKNN
jgi:diguanylate cyclase (GGDEF)-like protein/PAS domain S-box-containing protein